MPDPTCLTTWTRRNSRSSSSYSKNALGRLDRSVLLQRDFLLAWASFRAKKKKKKKEIYAVTCKLSPFYKDPFLRNWNEFMIYQSACYSGLKNFWSVKRIVLFRWDPLHDFTSGFCPCHLHTVHRHQDKVQERIDYRGQISAKSKRIQPHRWGNKAPRPYWLCRMYLLADKNSGGQELRRSGDDVIALATTSSLCFTISLLPKLISVSLFWVKNGIWPLTLSAGLKPRSNYISLLEAASFFYLIFWEQTTLQRIHKCDD